jgi:hypothetical protein
MYIFLNKIVLVFFSNDVDIFNINRLNQVDSFYPTSGFPAEGADQCLSYPAGNDEYHYHIAGGCMVNLPQGNLSVYSLTLTMIGIAKMLFCYNNLFFLCLSIVLNCSFVDIEKFFFLPLNIIIYNVEMHKTIVIKLCFIS